MSKQLSYKRKVNFYETDAQGIVHHSNYPRYFEEARGYFLEELGFPYHRVREELNIDIVLLELFVKYKQPLFFGDEFLINISLTKMDRFFFWFEYSVEKEGKILVTGKTKHCCIDRKTRKTVSVPKQIRELINDG